MKRTFLIIILVAITGILSAQRDRLDAFFDRYSGGKGYTTVNINGNLLGLFARFDDDEELDRLANKITNIRIVSTEDHEMHPGVNFYAELKDDIRRGNYEELITVKDNDDDVLVLVKTTGKTINEILIVASGENQTVVQIRGSLNQRDLDHLSRSNIDGLEYLEELEN